MSSNKRKLEALRLVDKRVKNDTMSFLPPNIDTSQQPPPGVPARPRNQNEAMAMANITVQPSEEDIGTFCAFTGRDREDAVRYLRAKGGNLEAAVNSCIEGEDVSGQSFAGPQQQQQQTGGQDDRTWDDSMFGKGKDYDDHLNDGTGRNMQSLAASGAPSRAPSRNSMHPTSKDEEDADMAEALKLSMGQETGVIGGNGVESAATTGPQPKSWYENSSQALILHPTQSSREMIPDPEPEDRKVGETGEPRFLKHVSDAEYLAPFLTVCHAIAGVREAMLMRGRELVSYGQDAEWWKGHEIKMPRVVHTDSGEVAESDVDKSDELLAECQRLMAFLDASSRSYASVAAVRGMISESVRGDSVLGRFIKSWITAAAKYRDEEQATDHFTTAVCSAEDDKVIGEHVTLDLTSTADKDSKQELTELLDLALWRFNEPDASYYVGRPASVITIKLRHQDTNAEAINVEAPTEFYIDKYLKEYSEATEPVRDNIRKGKARLNKIDSVEKKLRKMVPSGKTAEVDALKVLGSAKTYFAANAEDQRERTMLNGHLTNGVHPADDDAMETDEPVSGSEHYHVIADKLDKLIVDINKKLEILAAEKEKTLKAIRDATHTPLSGSITKDFKHKYMLRGVSTKPNTTYVLCAKPDDEDEVMLLDDAHDAVDKDDRTPEGMQWWRIEYDVVGSKARITKSRHADYEVTQAVALEHKEALLIYACDEVNDTIHTQALPDPLQDFVKADNALFDLELTESAKRRAEHERNNPPAYDLSDEYQWGPMAHGGSNNVRTSIEPKDGGLSRSGSMEHMEVSELGDRRESLKEVGPPGYEDAAFEDRDGFEMAPAKMGGYGGVQGSYNEANMEDADEVREIVLDEGEVRKSHVEDLEGMR